VRRRPKTLIVFAAVLAAGFWTANTVIGAGDPRADGDVTGVQTQPDGSTDIYRIQPSGEVIVEHREVSGETWFESNEVLGQDGQPIICSNGEPLRIDLSRVAKEPSASEIADAQSGLPDGKVAVFNEYTGNFEIVNGGTYETQGSTVTAMEPLVYKCGPDNEPVLVPLSQMDPEAAEQARRAFEEQARGSDALTGLGSDPANEAAHK
jgi:hypothetical protein